mgnify:CR=1 FL=1
MTFIDELDTIFQTAFDNLPSLSATGTYQYADLDEYWSRSKEHSFTYPLLWLHDQSLAHDSADSGNNPHVLGLSPQFAIVDTAPLNDYTAAREVTSRTYGYVLGILSFLNRYRRATGSTSPVLDKQRQINFSQIRKDGPDNTYGWLVTVPMQAQINLNLDAALWLQQDPKIPGSPGLPPEFFTL